MILPRRNSIIRWQGYRVSASRLAESNFRYTQLVDRKITSHVPVWDKSARHDGSFSRADFQVVEGFRDVRCRAIRCERPKNRKRKGMWSYPQCTGERHRAHRVRESPNGPVGTQSLVARFNQFERI